MFGGLKPLDKKLLTAARNNDLKQLKEALRRGANVNACEDDLETPLYIAVECGFTALVNHLVTQKGVQLNGTNLFGITLLGRATIYEYVKVLKTLLKAGANPNATQIFSQTPLHVAVRHGNIECIKELIKFGADVNAADCFDKTPLYISVVVHPQAQVTKLLLYAGADPNYFFKCQSSILSLAVLHARTLRQIKIIASLLKHGALINQGDKVLNETPLHKAAFTGYVPVIKFLVQFGASVKAQNVFGKVPFDIAFVHKHHAAAKVLKQLALKEEEEEIIKTFRKYSRK